MSERPCRKDDPNWPWLCSCDDCSRAAASAWRAGMDRVLSGEITLAAAITYTRRDTPTDLGHTGGTE